MSHIMSSLNALCWTFIVGAFWGGCAGNPPANPNFMGEGSGVSLPVPGTRVMILSNHKGALDRTAEWLRDQGLTVIDQSKVERELRDSAANLTTGGGRNLHIMDVAKAVGADLVVSTYLGRKFVPSDFGSQAMTIASVEVQGVEVGSGKVAFESKAWNSDPVVASEETVLGLTTMALQQSWKGEKSLTVAPLEVVAQERPEKSPDRAIPDAPDQNPAITASLEEGIQSRGGESLDPQSTDKVGEIPDVKPPLESRPQHPASSSREESSSIGLQMASGALSILYTPVKLVYAGLGGVFGGLAYVLTAGNTAVLQTILDASVEGTYWLTPDHLRGDEQVHFMGESTRVDLAQRHLGK